MQWIFYFDFANTYGHAVVATDDHVIRVYDSFEGHVLAVHRGHEDTINAIIHMPEVTNFDFVLRIHIQFIIQNEQYISAGWDRSIRVSLSFSICFYHIDSCRYGNLAWLRHLICPILAPLRSCLIFPIHCHLIRSLWIPLRIQMHPVLVQSRERGLPPLRKFTP